MSNQPNNTANMNVTTNGSVTRMTIAATAQASAAQTLQAAPYEANRVASGVTRFQMGSSVSDGNLDQTGVTKHNTFHDQKSDNVMGTFQRVNGQDTVELVPGVPGSRTTIKTALQDGLIVPMGNGQYQNATTGQNKPAQGQQHQPQGSSKDNPEAPVADLGAGVFNPGEDEDWNAAIEPLPQHSFDAAAASVTVAILSGVNNLDRAAHQLAESAAISPELAKQYVQEGYEMHERIVAKEAAAMGVTDKNGFYSWMQETKNKALQNAIQSLSTARNVQPFRTLALEYGRFTSELGLKNRPR